VRPDDAQKALIVVLHAGPAWIVGRLIDLSTPDPIDPAGPTGGQGTLTITGFTTR
jgi:hypothetical protein